MKKRGILFGILGLMLFAGFVFAAPTIQFVNPTPISDTPGNSIYVNLSTNDSLGHYSFVDFNSSLIFWANFDEANEDVIYDLSSYGNNGKLLNGANLGLGGVYRTMANFDGVDDYINFSDPSSFNSISTNGEMTFCLWMNPKTTSSPYSTYVAPIGQWRTMIGATSVNERSWGLLEELTCGAGKYGLFVSANGGSPYGTACTNSVVPLNQWTHICGKYDNPDVVLYVNGVEQTTKGSSSGIYNSPAPFTIGTYLFTASSSRVSDIFFNGSVDDVLLFNRALSLQEIRAIYNSTAYQYEYNYTSLQNATYNVTAHAVNTNSERSFLSRLISTFVSGSSAPGENLSASFIFPTPSENVSGNSIYVNLSVSGEGALSSFVDFDEDLAFWMRMDDRNSSGGFVDRSSYGNNGTGTGIVVNSNYGYFGNGTYFNDTSFIDVPDSASLDLPALADKITVCSWFKIGQHGTEYTGIVARYNTLTANSDRQYLLARNNSNNRYGIFLSASGATFDASVLTDSELNLNQWYHLCGTYNGTTVLLYLDGNRQAQTATLSGIKDSINSSLFIGKFGRANSEFNGSIDEVLIFKRALSSEEVKAMYDSSVYHYEYNFTNLTAGEHTFTGYVLNSSGSIVFESRMISSGVSMATDNFPSVTLNSPSDLAGFTGYSVTFNVSVSDDYQLENVSLFGNWSGWHLNQTNSSGINGEYIFVVNLTSFGEGSYIWGISAWDNNSQQTFSSNRTFTIDIPEALPVITLGAPSRQEKGHGQIFKLNLTTSNPADGCWFTVDNGTTNVSMAGLGSQYFFYEEMTAGVYNITFYCENSYGETSLNSALEFRRAVFYEDQHYTNSQGLDIYFDFGFNSTSESSKLIVIPDSWNSEKDDTWVVQTELLYVGQGYVAVPVNTRGKGLSEGTRDAFGWECLDIYELIKHLENTDSYNSLFEDGVYYISGASGAGGKAGVCSAKYPDLFTGAFSSVGVLNLTRWWYSNPPGYFASIGQRVGCTPPECPEAYIARDASYLNYNTQTPIKLVSNADDASVTIQCSRDYNQTMHLNENVGNYLEFPTGGHGTYRFSESLEWFANYTSPVSMPSEGDLRVGGYVQTKNFSLFMNEVNVSHIAFVDYNLSGMQKKFLVTTLGFNGTMNLSIFDLSVSTDYEVVADGDSSIYSSDSSGDLEFEFYMANESSILITIEQAGEYCGDLVCNNGESCSSCVGDCGACVPQDNGGNTGGGGGGGGGVPPKVYNSSTEVNVEFSSLPITNVKKGTTSDVVLTVTNREKIFLNNCGLRFSGSAASWMKSSQSSGLSQGEKVNYLMKVSVPENIEPGKYSANVLIQCDEGRANKDLSFNVYRNNFEAEILSYEKKDNQLVVTYSLQEYANTERTLSIDYFFKDTDNVTRYGGNVQVSLGQQEERTDTVSFNLPKDSFGEFVFEMKFNDGSSEITVTKDVFLPSQKGLSGLVISDSNKRALSIFGVVLFAVLFIVFAFWTARRLKKKTRRIEVMEHSKSGQRGRKFITVEI